jgi:hypothetical protein
MPINQLHLTFKRLLLQLRPGEHITRICNWSRLLVGLCLSQSVHLSKIANKLPTKATLPSTTRRLSRLLDNPAIRVRDWYEPIARSLLERAAKGGEIRLIVDGSKVGFNHRLLMVGLAYRKRTIPIAWSWVPSEKGHSSSYKQRALLGYVRLLMPDEAARRVLVIGDSEFGAIETLEQLEEWGWYYVMRQKSSHLVCLKPQQPQQQWRPLGELIERRGEKVWLEGVLLSRLHAHQTNLLLYWKKGEKEPWLLATNRPSSKEALLGYKKRMWIEGMFADFKGQGFNLESTRLRRLGKLSRLTLAVAMLYVWLVVYGAEVVKRGQRKLVDRPDRRDHSLFRLGLNMLERCLAQGIRPFVGLLPSSLPKLSGG